MQTKKIKVGVVGGAGYTGGELLRLLVNHPNTELVYVVSKSQAGKKIHDVHYDLIGETDLQFSNNIVTGADIVFLCLQHSESKIFLEEKKFLPDAKIIDLSRDFRNENNGFVYGLPEMNANKISNSNYVANPGCFATAIQLGLLPLASINILRGDINVNATTGSTGAGQKLSDTTHFSWRNNNLSVYKAFEHEHIPEIKQSLKQLQNDFSSSVNFIPQRGSFSRGILASTTLDCSLSLAEAENLFSEFYERHPFVHLTKTVDVKQVTNTNKCYIQLIKHENQLAIISVIDNLLKGAAGQAVQNMNLMFGLEETAGLKLKANVF
ncbi:MAG: N-acetyl-gamma-glutamyl-phosphate reductase [Bacteroidia bacterium]